MSTEKEHPTDKEVVLLERVRSLEAENRELQHLRGTVIACFQKTEPAWDTISKIYASGNVPEVLVQADPKALEALQELLWGTFEFDIKYAHESPEPKAQRFAALVREALDLIPHVRDEQDAYHGIRSTTYTGPDTHKVEEAIRTKLEALEKEP